MATSLIATAGQAALTRLVSSGVQRLGSLIFQKVCRTLKIEHALRSGMGKNPNLQKAVADFERVIGSRYGSLTEKLDAFLNEIERTGIINSMVENAILQRDSAELQELFSDIHEKFMGPHEGDASALYKQLSTSFAVTMNELTTDRVMLDAIRLHRAEIEGKLGSIQDALAAITHRFKLSKTTRTFDDLTEVIAKIAKALQTSYRTIRVETNMVAHLSLQIKSYRNLRRQNEIVDFLLSSLEKARGKDQKAAVASFSARALEYLAASEGHIRILVAKVFERAVQRGWRSDAMRDLARCCECSVERRPFVRSVVAELLVKEFKRLGPTEGVKLPLRRRRNEHGTETQTLPVDVIMTARRDLEQFITPKMDVYPAYAALALEWYGTFTYTALMKVGIQGYFNYSTEGIDGLTLLVLCTSEQYNDRFNPGAITRDKALEVLSIIGSYGFSRLHPRDGFRDHSDTAPLDLWLDLLKKMRSNPPAMLGAFFCMLVVGEKGGRLHRGNVSDEAKAGWQFSRLKAWELVSKVEGVRRIKNFTKAQQAFESGSVFMASQAQQGAKS